MDVIPCWKEPDDDISSYFGNGVHGHRWSVDGFDPENSTPTRALSSLFKISCKTRVAWVIASSRDDNSLCWFDALDDGM